MSTVQDATAAAQPPNPALNPPAYIYRIVTAAEWRSTFEANGRYTGGALDRNDGFIHISSKEDTAKTAELYYANEKEILLVQLTVSELLPAGKLIWDWVPSRQTYFPHLYDLVDGFQAQHIKKVHQIAYDEAAQKHIIPDLE